MAFATASDGVPLYVEAHGTGLPLVLSCAYCTTHENWRGQVDDLVAAGMRVILWDYRGHGRSGVPEDPSAYTMEQVVDDLGRVLDWAATNEPAVPPRPAEPARGAVLGGLSFGGLASLHFAIPESSRVRALVLAGSGPGFKNPSAQADWEAQVERTASFIETRGFEAFVGGKAAPTCIGLYPELPAAQAAARAICEQDPRGVTRFARRVAGPAEGVIDELPGIACPALVLVGEHDKAFRRAAEVLEAKLPNAQRRVIPAAGHIANIDAAADFNAQVVDFLASLPGEAV